MKSFTVYGHVLADRLPKHTVTIGDSWLRYLPQVQRAGGGPKMEHVNMGPDIDYISTVPAHTLIHSRWQVGFKGIKAPNEDVAVERVRRTYVPRLQAAYHFSTGLDVDVVLSGVVDEKTQEDRSVWSYSASTSHLVPSSLETDEVVRANSASKVLQTNSTALAAAELLSRAESRSRSAGGIVAFQAAAVLDAVMAIEKITRQIHKEVPLKEPMLSEDATIQRLLSKLAVMVSKQVGADDQLGLIKQISRRAAEVSNLGMVALLKVAVDELQLRHEDLTTAKSLWRLRGSKLAHPGSLADDLSQEVEKSIVLGRSFLDAYISREMVTVEP